MLLLHISFVIAQNGKCFKKNRTTALASATSVGPTPTQASNFSNSEENTKKQEQDKQKQNQEQEKQKQEREPPKRQEQNHDQNWQEPIAIKTGGCLDAHNEVRQRFGYSKLSWSAQLEQSATEYARTLASSGEFKHGRVGENLAKGVSDCAAAVGMWVAERNDYKGEPLGKGIYI